MNNEKIDKHVFEFCTELDNLVLEDKKINFKYLPCTTFRIPTVFIF